MNLLREACWLFWASRFVLVNCFLKILCWSAWWCFGWIVSVLSSALLLQLLSAASISWCYSFYESCCFAHHVVCFENTRGGIGQYSLLCICYLIFAHFIKHMDDLLNLLTIYGWGLGILCSLIFSDWFIKDWKLVPLCDLLTFLFSWDHFLLTSN